MKADFIPAKPHGGNLRPREVTHLMQDHTTKMSTGPKIYGTCKSSTRPKKLLAPESSVPTLAGIEISKNGKVSGVGSSSEESWGKIQKTVYADVADPSPNAEVSQKCILKTLMSQNAQWKRILWSNQFRKCCIANPRQWSPKAQWLTSALKRLPVEEPVWPAQISTGQMHLTTEPFYQ